MGAIPMLFRQIAYLIGSIYLLVPALGAVEAAFGAASIQPIVVDEGFAQRINTSRHQADLLFKTSSDDFLSGGPHGNGVKRRFLDGTDVPNFSAPVGIYFSEGTGAFALISAFAQQPDGKIFVGGYFPIPTGTTPRSSLLRMYPNGALDETFDPSGTGLSSANPSVGLAAIADLALQTNDHLLVLGSFVTASGQTNLTRLTPSGALDPSFQAERWPKIGWPGPAVKIALQHDGKILVGGRFSDPTNTTPRAGIVRLLPDGSLDPSFQVHITPWVDGGDLYSIEVLPTGEILIGGYFAAVNGDPKRNLVRLHADGSIDTTFVPPEFTGGVRAILPEANGRYWIGGGFSRVNGFAHSGIVRLLNDGTLDPSFTAGAGIENGGVHSIIPADDSSIIIAGSFQIVNGIRTGTPAKLYSNPLQLTSVQFTRPSHSVVEGASSLLQLRRTGNLSYPVTLRCRTERISATPDTDFASFDREITFLPGETNKTVSTTTLSDHLNEPEDTFAIILESLSEDLVLGANSRSLLTIVDDDREGSLVSNFDPAYPAAFVASLRNGSILVSPPPTSEFPLRLTWPILTRLSPEGLADPSFALVRFHHMHDDREVESVNELDDGRMVVGGQLSLVFSESTLLGVHGVA